MQDALTGLLKLAETVYGLPLWPLAFCCDPRQEPLGYSSPYLACRTGHWVPICRPLTGSPSQ
jgi:hypothetical protein